MRHCGSRRILTADMDSAYKVRTLYAEFNVDGSKRPLLNNRSHRRLNCMGMKAALRIKKWCRYRTAKLLHTVALRLRKHTARHGAPCSPSQPRVPISQSFCCKLPHSPTIHKFQCVLSACVSQSSGYFRCTCELHGCALSSVVEHLNSDDSIPLQDRQLQLWIVCRGVPGVEQVPEPPAGLGEGAHGESHAGQLPGRNCQV